MMILRVALAVAVLGLGALRPEPAQAGAVLDRVKRAGILHCGILKEPEDYGKNDVHGALVALGADFCRAIAAAVLGDPDKVTGLAVSDERHGFEALQASEVDLLLGASPSRSSAIAFGVAFTSPLFLDGEGTLVHRDAGITSFADLAGKQVCFIANTEAESALDSEVRRRNLHVLPFPFEEEGEMQTSLTAGHCDAVIDSVSRLALARADFGAQAKDFVILPDRLSVEPMSPAVKEGDAQWTAVVELTRDALLLAEANGTTRAKAESIRSSRDPVATGLGGLVPGVGESTIDRQWAERAVAAGGNYGELYERDCGSQSPLDIPRGPNALWGNGGLMFAPASR